ncbi:MAG TPA: hypothetical protein VN751_02185 [Solirubrobacteraceae bacterium]|jgi:hypothetical protein|nr:hypothetical protein [Solirubrobacteraceae bacterium]
MTDASPSSESERDAPGADEAAAQEAPPSEAVVADASAPVGSPEAVERPPAPPDGASSPGPAAPERAEAPEPPPAPPEGEAPPAPDADRSRRRRSRGRGKGGQRADRPQRGARGPRERGPLPFPELREAASTVADLFGQRRAVREAYSVLGDKERADLARLVAEDGDWRVRARKIAAGSLGAGRVGKALAAQQVSMAAIEELWTLTLSKEEADDRRARVRNARRRDERRSQREADRERRTDRVSRADLAKAQDGRVGATIRIVMPGERGGGRRRRDEGDGEQGGSDVLDRLGY